MRGELLDEDSLSHREALYQEKPTHLALRDVRFPKTHSMKVTNKSAVKTKHIRVLGALEVVTPHGEHISEFSSKFSDALGKLSDELVTTASSLELKANTAVVARIFREYESALDTATSSTDFRPLIEKIIQSATLLLVGSAQKQLVAKARKVADLTDRDGCGPTYIAEHVMFSGISAEALAHHKGAGPFVIILGNCPRENLQQIARVLPDVEPTSTLVVMRKPIERNSPAERYLERLLGSFDELGGWITIEGDLEFRTTIREFIHQA